MSPMSKPEPADKSRSDTKPGGKAEASLRSKDSSHEVDEFVCITCPECHVATRFRVMMDEDQSTPVSKTRLECRHCHKKLILEIDESPWDRLTTKRCPNNNCNWEGFRPRTNHTCPINASHLQLEDKAMFAQCQTCNSTWTVVDNLCPKCNDYTQMTIKVADRRCRKGDFKGSTACAVCPVCGEPW